MTSVLEWLRHVEELACDFYAEAADYFLEDKPLSRFLLNLSRDEAWHYHLIGSTTEFNTSSEDFPPLAIGISEETIERVEIPLRKCREEVPKGDVSRREVIGCVVDTEFSEWNDVFVYVMNTLQGRSRTFQRAAATIQAHEQKISAFLDSLLPDSRPARNVGELPKIWKHRYLVVDDDKPTRELFYAFLSRSAEVVTAENGEEALERLQQSFFDIAVSDIDMPVMNGVELFRRVSEFDSEARRRFVFCSGNVTPEVAALCSQNGLAVLQKPVALTEMKSEIERQILAASADPAESGEG